ncbi:alpha/beta fold hydrolase [Streptomyces dangxiongensis]|uniref:alpha/beta fold hydrolase n=1 Tax=Streptomyces dangxiongensis TaxID=1442032 RepID=UPI001F091B54|nr:alpha/beta fold hydrolase [Streptomyces dangxiongensis]
MRGYRDTDKPASGYDERTMANDVVALMDHLGHERIALVGHDRGARVGTRFAEDHPDRIDRFVALDSIPTRIIAGPPRVAVVPGQPPPVCHSWARTGRTQGADRHMHPARFLYVPHVPGASRST